MYLIVAKYLSSGSSGHRCQQQGVTNACPERGPVLEIDGSPGHDHSIIDQEMSHKYS